MRRFNVTGVCVPSKDYMVDIGGKLEKIMRLIDGGCYFTINRARQYGKTTTLSRIQKTISSEYVCARISFQGVGDRSFETPEAFCHLFTNLVCDSLKFATVEEEYRKKWLDGNVVDFPLLSRHITALCKDKKIVLLIDEVDSTSNNRVFLYFLSMLREKFLMQREDMDFTFQSVVLAGVYDIKNIKLKMINEGTYTPSAGEQKIYNSPWNIAVDFEVDMSFNPDEIATMLADYETDHHTGMDIISISNEIYDHTSGYPFLVSRICQHIDEKLTKNWTSGGIKDAVQILLEERNTLFDDIIKNLENNKTLYEYMYNLLIRGGTNGFNTDDPIINLGLMYGFLKNASGKVAIANKIFEIRISNYFISKETQVNLSKKINGVLQYDVVKGGKFDMELCLKKFAEHFAEIYNERDHAFLESHGRMLFLSYLKPLINGQGFYHIESQFTDLRRMDIVVDFGREQFIIELKMWRGEYKHQEAYEQLLGYMDSKKADTGYLLTFDLRKGSNRELRAEWMKFEPGSKRIYDVVV